MRAESKPESWLEENSEYRTVELVRPIQVDGESVRVLRVREPRMIDLERLPAEAFLQPMSILVHVLARCASVPPSSIRMLSARDSTRCAEVLGEMGFIPTDAFALLGASSDSPETGPTG